MTYAEVSQWADELLPVFDQETDAGHICLIATGSFWTIGVDQDPDRARFVARMKAAEMRMAQVAAEAPSTL